jgi:hypothetical protein
MAMNREQLNQLYRDRAGTPRTLSDAVLDRDFFTAGPHNAQLPPEQHPRRKGKSSLMSGEPLRPLSKQPCSHNLCDGTGHRLARHNPSTGTKTYVLCPCRGGRA